MTTLPHSIIPRASSKAYVAAELAVTTALYDTANQLSEDASSRDYLIAVIKRLQQLLVLHDSDLRDIDLQSEDVAALEAAAHEPDPPPADMPGVVNVEGKRMIDLDLRTSFGLSTAEAAAFPTVVGLTGKPGAGKDMIAIAFGAHLAALGRSSRIMGVRCLGRTRAGRHSADSSRHMESSADARTPSIGRRDSSLRLIVESVP